MADTMDWVRKISSKLPDIKHYHIVFTLPSKLRSLSKRNKTEIYNLLFSCGQSVIKEFFWEQYRLKPGIISVLHSNGSDLKYHPHTHLIVSNGGFNKDGELVVLDNDYLVSQRRLADSFREKFIIELGKKIGTGKIATGVHQDIKSLFKNLRKQQWIVNIESPLLGVEKVIAYVGRYTKKSCISERRILEVKDGMITLSYKDYKNSNRGEKPKESTIRLPVFQFLDRLLEHIPEKGFKVVRYHGIYSSCQIKCIPQESRLKNLNIAEHDISDLSEHDLEIDLCPFKKYRRQVYQRTGKDPLYCYGCHQTMKLIEVHYLINGETEIIEVYDSD